MKKMCKVCHREDEYVLDDGLCILHCSKTEWKRNGKWNTKYVAKFWSVIRNEIMNKAQKHNFTFMIFPPMQRAKTREGHATIDHSFWKTGTSISFNQDVDFSFSRFEESLTFNAVSFKNLKMNNVNAKNIKLNHCHIQEANFNKYRGQSLTIYQNKINKLTLEDSSLEELHLSKSTLEICDFNLSKSALFIFEENKIERLKMYKTKVENMQFEGGFVHRVHIFASSCRTVLMNRSKTHTFRFENSNADHVSLQNSSIQEYNLNKSKIKSELKITNVTLKNLILYQNKFSLLGTLKFKKLTLNNLSMVNNDKISLFKLENSTIDSIISIKGTDLLTCELKDVDMHNALLTLERCNMKEAYFERVDFNSFDKQTFHYDLSSLTMLEALFKEGAEKESLLQIQALLNDFIKEQEEEALFLSQSIQEESITSKKEKILTIFKKIKAVGIQTFISSKTQAVYDARAFLTGKKLLSN